MKYAGPVTGALHHLCFLGPGIPYKEEKLLSTPSEKPIHNMMVLVLTPGWTIITELMTTHFADPHTTSPDPSLRTIALQGLCSNFCFYHVHHQQQLFRSLTYLKHHYCLNTFIIHYRISLMFYVFLTCSVAVVCHFCCFFIHPDCRSLPAL